MRILTTYTLRHLRLSRRRTAVTILGVALSTALICGVLLLGASFQQLMVDHEVATVGRWHARLRGVPRADARAIAESAAVQTAMLSASLGSAADGSRNAVRPYLYVTAYDAASFQNRPVTIISGRLPRRSDELVVSRVMVEDTGLDLRPGSTLRLAFGTRNIPNRDELVRAWGGEEFVHLAEGETFTASAARTYTVVGVMEPLFDETSMPAAFPALTALDPGQLAAVDRVDVSILARDPRGIGALAPELARRAGLPADRIDYNEDLLAWVGASGRSRYAGVFLAVVGTALGLVVVGSALVIANAFAISVGERTRQFGLLASVGATPAQIRRAVLAEAAAVAAAGILPGILGAVAGAGGLLRLTRGIVAGLVADAERGMPLVVPPAAVGLAALLSAATVLLSAWAPARRASRAAPIDAIRQGGELREAGPRAMRASPLVRRLLGFEGELALRSLRRDRRRHRATLLSLVVSIVLFVTFNALMLYTTTTQGMASRAMNFDLIVDLDYRQSHARQFSALVGELPEVRRVAYRRSAYQMYAPPPAALTGQAREALRELEGQGLEGLPRPGPGGAYQFVLEVSAVGPAEFARYAAQLGLDPRRYSDPSAPLAILIDHPSLRQGGKLYDVDLFSLRPGDTMTVSPMAGWPSQQAGGAPASLTWTVGAVTRETPLGFLAATLVPELIVSDPVFDGMSDRMLRLGPINPGAMYIQSRDPEAAVRSIRRLYGSTVGGSFSYTSVAELNRSSELRALLLSLFFYGFLALVTLVGVTSIVNTLDASVKLRRREIAMLRSAGLTPGGLRRVLRNEGLFLGLAALLYGLPLGVALSALLYAQLGGVSSFPFTLPWGAILACAAVVPVLVAATMRVSGAMVRGDAIIDALRDELA